VVLNDAGDEFRYILFNHWNIVVEHQEVENSLHRRIVGFYVEPRSLGKGASMEWSAANEPPLYLDDLLKHPEGSNEREFSFTYSILSRKGGDL